MPSVFHKFSNAVSRGAGRPATFAVACGLIVAWAVSGPFFGFSETWQLVVNTATTIVTFLMVFVLQHTQNRDQEAIQAKLDELIFAGSDADNAFIGVEKLTTAELHALRQQIDEAVASRRPDRADQSQKPRRSKTAGFAGGRRAAIHLPSPTH